MIYFVQARDGGPIKISFTNNMQRLQEMQSYSPLVLLGACEGDFAREKELQRQFSEYHIQGEWFQPHEKIKNYIRTYCNERILPEFTKDFNLEKHLEEYECSIIRKAISLSKNKQKASEVLGISYRSLRHRLSKYKITP